MSDITSQSLTSLVNNIKKKKLSSEDVTKEFVTRSERSKQLNAYISEDFSNSIKVSVIILLALSILISKKS